MTNLIRFGRRISMPSTTEIKHDLRLMATTDAIMAKLGDAPQTAETQAELAHVVGDLATKHGLSRDRAAMLVARFRLGRDALENAAQDLRTSKD